MASAAFLTTAAQAQVGEITLVGNFDAGTPIGHGRTHAILQRFTTGSETYGYVLKSVVVAYDDSERDSVSAKVCAVTDTDQPTSTCTDFTAPSVSDGGNRTFTAPGNGMYLAPETKYAVVLTKDDPNPSTQINYSTAGTGQEDSDSLPGWNIANTYRIYDGTSWVTIQFNHRSIRIRLTGRIIEPADPNANATGAPGITGPAQVGRTLTARMGDIADRDGLPSGRFPDDYFFQWIGVVEGEVEDIVFDIPGANSATYTPVDDDEMNRLKFKVRVRFIDRSLTLETRTSGATNPVVPDAVSCPAASVWCTVLTAGSKFGGDVVGYRVSDGLGSLDDDTFSFDGAGYTVTQLTSGGSTAIDLNTAPLLPADGGGLTLHVQRLNGTLVLSLDAADDSPHDNSGHWNWNGAIDTGPANPSLLRRFARFNQAYTNGTDAGTRIMVRLSRQAGVSFDAPTYLAYEAGQAAAVTVTLTPAPTSSVTIPIVATGQDGATSADWTGAPSSLTFAPGESSKTFTVTAVEDGAADEGESVELGFGTLPPGVDEGYRTTTTVHFFDRASPGDARLVGGNGLPTAGDEGRLEVFYQGQWGTVCDDRMDRGFTVYDSNPPRTVATNHAPTLACELLGRGYNKGELIDLGPYRARDGVPRPIWLDDLRCEEGGTHWTGKPATRLDHCFHAGIGRDNCTHNDDVALRCLTVVQQTVIEPLRVAFVDVPKTGHDGETAFTFRLDFSEAVAITAEDMRDHALEVSGATVTSAALADGRDDLWEFTLEPSGTDFVAITVAGKDSCSDTGALCTALGAGLENRLSTVIPYVPPAAVAGLTAEFVDVPEEHSGDSYSTFRVELLFSEEVKVSNNRMRKRILKLANATLEEARRIDRRKDYWEFRIRPASHRAITLSLKSAEECGARDVICTFDGRPLSEPATATIIGPPGMSVADAEVEEGPDAVLEFVVTLDRSPRREVTVNYETFDGTAVAGEDYVRANGMLAFAAGETEKTVSVQVLDDAHNEGEETLTLRLGGPVGAWLADAEAVGTIHNTDHMPLAWMVRFGRTVGSQVVDALGARFERGGSSRVRVAGVDLLGNAALEAPEEAPGGLSLSQWDDEAPLDGDAHTLTGEELRERLLMRSAFHLTSGESGAGGARLTAWGEVSRGGFEADEGDTELDGRVTTGLVGVDAQWERALAGVLVSQSRGTGSYRQRAGAQDSGGVESTLTGVYPYGRLELTERVSAWGIAGMGRGDIELRRDGYDTMRTDTAMRMGALGVTGQVLDGTGPSALEVNVKTDALWVRMSSEDTEELAPTEGDVTRLRFIVEGERRFELGAGATLTPAGEVGVRLDGGDAETGAGVEVGLGARYESGSLAVEGRVRGLVAHEDTGYEEWGASGAIRIRPDASGRGLTLSIQPVWGRASSASERLWSAPDARALERGEDFDAEGRLEAELGYGLSVPRTVGVVTPYTGMTLGDGGDATVRAGARWQMDADARLGVEGTRAQRDGEETAHDVMLRLRVEF